MSRASRLFCMVLYLQCTISIVTAENVLQSVYSNQLTSIESQFTLNDDYNVANNTDSGIDYRDHVFPSYRAFIDDKYGEIPCRHCCSRDYSDNIAGRDFEHGLCSEPIDAVYTWVNGSDPLQQRSLGEWKAKLLGIKPDTGNSASLNRFVDHDELKYSLRSISQFAPFLRNVYIVTNGQIPRFQNLTHPRLKVVPHSVLFTNSSHLPTFNSAAIETHLHRIPGLSSRFLYFNDDVMQGNTVYPSDFFDRDKYKVYRSWPLPLCASQCHHEYLGDGECDSACNVAECYFDLGDCKTAPDYKGTVSTNHTEIDSKFKLPTISVKYASTNTTLHGKFFLPKEKQAVYIDMSNVMGPVGKVTPQSSLIVSAEHNNTVLVSKSVVHNNYKAQALVLRPFYGGNDVVRVKITIRGRLEKPSGSQVYIFGSDNEGPSVIEKPVHIDQLIFRNSTINKLSGVTTIKRRSVKSPQTQEQREWESLRRYLPQLTSSVGIPPLSSLDMGMLRRTALSVPGREEIQEIVHTLIKLHKRAKRGFIQVQVLANEPDLAGVDEDDLEEALQIYYSHRTFVNAQRARLRKEKQFPWKASNNTANTQHLATKELYVLDKNDTIALQQVMTESSSTGRKLADAFGDSLRFVDKLYNEEFGLTKDRKVIAHMPHAIDTRVVTEMQQMFSKEVDATSSHKLRASDDIQYAFSYYYYIVHARPNKEQFINRILLQSDFNQNGIYRLKELRHLSSVISHLVDIDGSVDILQNITNFHCNVSAEMAISSFIISNSTTNVSSEVDYGSDVVSDLYRINEDDLVDTSQYNDDDLSALSEFEQEVLSHRLKTQKSVRQCNQKYRQHELLRDCVLTKQQLLSSQSFHRYMDVAHSKARKFQHEFIPEEQAQAEFFMLPNNVSVAQTRFDKILKDRPKFVCINDDIHGDPDPRVLQELHDFYETYYPLPSEFELTQPGSIAYYDTYVSSVNGTALPESIVSLDAVVEVLQHSQHSSSVQAVRVSTLGWVLLITVLATLTISFVVTAYVLPYIFPPTKEHMD